MNEDKPRHPLTFVGVIEIGLSFLVPFIGVPVAVTVAFVLYHGEEVFRNLSTLMIVVCGAIAVATALGVVNAVGYYRKKCRA